MITCGNVFAERSGAIAESRTDSENKMPKETFANYFDELQAQRDAWQRKANLRALYRRWYARIVAALSPQRPVVELGSGCGNFKSFIPEVFATDVFPCGPWIDMRVDARRLPFAENSIGNVVMIDCLHHLPRPIDFLRGAARCLRPGGRVVLFEPAATPWARFVWRRFHHEPCDLSADLFATVGKPEPENANFTYSNMATATLLFLLGRDRFEACVPELKIERVEHSDFVVYPATGGFSYRGFVPGAVLPVLHAIESAITRPTARWLTAMRLLVVLEKPAA